eukprot:6184569-Pleurochrysis_carterae.AAC.1
MSTITNVCLTKSLRASTMKTSLNVSTKTTEEGELRPQSRLDYCRIHAQAGRDEAKAVCQQSLASVCALALIETSCVAPPSRAVTFPGLLKRGTERITCRAADLERERAAPLSPPPVPPAKTHRRAPRGVWKRCHQHKGWRNCPDAISIVQVTKRNKSYCLAVLDTICTKVGTLQGQLNGVAKAHPHTEAGDFIQASCFATAMPTPPQTHHLLVRSIYLLPISTTHLPTL